MSVEDMHTEANVPMLLERGDTHLLTLMLDRTNYAAYLDVAARPIRQSSAPLLKVPRPITNRLNKAPIYRGSKAWNELPPMVRIAKSRLHFRNLLKRQKTGRPLDQSTEEGDE